MKHRSQQIELQQKELRKKLREDHAGARQFIREINLKLRAQRSQDDETTPSSLYEMVISQN